MAPTWYRRTPAHFRDDPRFQRLTLEQQAVCIYLIDSIHLSEDGALPWPDEDVAMMSHMPADAVKAVLASGFLHRDGDGWLRCWIIDESRNEYESKRSAGKLAADKRWKNRRNVVEKWVPIGYPLDTQCQPNAEERRLEETRQDNTPLPPKGGVGGDASPSNESVHLFANAHPAVAAEPPTPKKRERRPVAQLPDVPPSLNTPEFRVAWRAWEQRCDELGAKHRLRPSTAKAQLKKLEKMGHDRAIAALEHSTGTTWLGIFEPGPATNGKARGNDYRMEERIVVREFE